MRAVLAALLLSASPALATSPCEEPAAVCEAAGEGAFPLVADGASVPILADGRQEEGVIRAIRDLRTDLGRVSGTAPTLFHGTAPREKAIVVIGTLGQSPFIDRLVARRKLDIRGVKGEWEAYLHQVVENPAPGIARALVIAGSDKRGTIFGAYHLSEKIGVSPWHYWADVPARKYATLSVRPGRLVEKPKVRYRGIFLNDEEPALGNWARATHGGFNRSFYSKVFELILRQRGNYLWPAMWGKAFYVDDAGNAALADEMGVVIGTSHHEPMARAHVEWERHGDGPWDYGRNAERLRGFWREGIARMGNKETLVTVGMRGDGDEPMTEGTAIGLLETIVKDQRQIIADVTGRPARETPQVWALYKEVQDYYDKGMTVPDDVTLLFADDNWGNIRRLPKPGAKRPGGFGVYYHFDYVGGPRNYKWINTTQIERVWEQMHTAYAYGADRLWIVNVGDLKPMEFPTSFFLDYAWNPDAWPLEHLSDFPRDWAERQFGPEHAGEIGELLTRYTQYNARRKPELVEPGTFSLTAFGEAERVMAEWNALAARAGLLARAIPADQKDAYFQLVLYPIFASANLNDLYITVAKNRAAAERGDPAANDLAARARGLYARHLQSRRRYEEEIAGGKWKHMMSQAVFGYTGWQQPDAEVMPEVRTVPEGAPRTASPTAEPTSPYAAFEAEHHARAVGANGIGWKTIPNLGRTLSGVAPFPVTAPAQEPGKGPFLEYRFDLPSAAEVEVELVHSPSLDVRGGEGLRYAVSIDDAPPVLVNVHEGGMSEAEWNVGVANNAWTTRSKHRLAAAGAHRLRVWMVDPGLVLQRVHVLTGPIPETYLGPPEGSSR
ncbi:MAG TPA: glycosyl hydrolase 115 family protein [Allosphingosinicella sp.]|jgi:hypothetical protein